jgi:hypothetical protein
LHNLVQVPEMKVVEFSQMRDKESQQRRGRAYGPIGSVADRIAVEENRALAPETAQESTPAHTRLQAVSSQAQDSRN